MAQSPPSTVGCNINTDQGSCPEAQGTLPLCTLHCLTAQPPARRYHDGYLTIHFEANKYQDIELSPLQEEALWCARRLPCRPHSLRTVGTS